MKLWCMILCIACTVILSGLTIAQETKSPPNLKARIKLFKNTKRFSVSYDKFKDITEVSIGPFAVSPVKGSVLGMYADFSFSGQTVREDVSTIRLTFSSFEAARGGRWTFADHRNLYGIIDGERLELGEGAWTPHSDREHHSIIFAAAGSPSEEELIFTWPIATFRKIAEAKVVELKVGATEIKIKDEHFIAFKDLLSLTKRE